MPPLPQNKTKQNKNSSTCSAFWAAVPEAGRQGAGSSGLCGAGGSRLERSWLHDVCFCICWSLSTFQSSPNLTAAHLFPLPPPQSATPLYHHYFLLLPPPPTVRMQPLNSNPDHGKSARWSLFPTSNPHPTLPPSFRKDAGYQSSSNSLFQLDAGKEGGSGSRVWDGASQHWGLGGTCSHYSLVGLRGGDCVEPDGGLLPSPLPVLQCSLCSVLRVMRPHLREGMGANC